MEEIKVGEYVRTKRGIIDRVIIDYYGICNSPNCNCKHVSCQYNYYDEEDIVKHSNNIIDSIEVGDYVNKRLVLQVDYKNKNVCLLISFTDTKANINTIWCGQEDIKSIVTHEQFEQVEYKI